MPVIIENLSPRSLPDDQDHEYRLRVNEREIVRFKHRRNEGLALCLHLAAQAVQAAKNRKSDK